MSTCAADEIVRGGDGGRVRGLGGGGGGYVGLWAHDCVDLDGLMRERQSGYLVICSHKKSHMQTCSKKRMIYH